MVTILITSLSEGTGKTAICTSIGKYLINQGKKVGYLRPVIGTASNNGDAKFMKETLNLQEPAETLCPTYSSEIQFNTDFPKVLSEVSSGKDVVLVECANTTGIQGLSAKIIPVVTYTELTEDKVNSAYQAMSQQLAGIVINKVPLSQLNSVRQEATANSGKLNISVLGVIPEDRLLLTFSITELAGLIDGQVLNNTDKTNELVGNIMLGAMTVDSALPYFDRIPDKAVVIRSSRPDMQMAALQTPTRVMVLAGNTPMIPQVKNLAEDKMVPVITTGHDVAAIVQCLEEGILQTKFHQHTKVARMVELTAQGFDFQLLSKSCNI